MSMTRGALWVIALAVALTGCAPPQYSYVTNSTANTYFKVPGNWHRLSDAALSSALHAHTSGGGLWSVGYDGSGTPSVSHLFGVSSSAPFAFALVEPLSAPQSSAMSYNVLRDFYLPVTVGMRQADAQRGFQLSGFHLLSDQVLTPGQGVHGIREIFQYTFPGGHTNTFDQIALTNSDDTVVYLLVLHCLATCYQRHFNEIEQVMQSFTVRSTG